MSNDSFDRRQFLQTASVGTVMAASGSSTAEPAKPAMLPQKVLGKTKVSVPAMGLGTAPAGFLPEKEAISLFNACIDAGVTYLDTAPELGGYGRAQKFLAPVLKERRDQVFVVTKCFEPDGEKALALLKANLAELGIERADLVYAHSIGADEMPPTKIYGAAGVCKALDKAKKDGLTRFVGVSGHNRPGRFLQAMKEWDYDVQMNAVSLIARHIYDFEGKVWPEAAKRNIGLAAMKIFGGAQAGNARLPEELRRPAFRYALGLPQVTVTVVGIKSAAELKQNLEWLKDAKALSEKELADLAEPTKKLAEKWGEVYGKVT